MMEEWLYSARLRLSSRRVRLGSLKASGLMAARWLPLRSNERRLRRLEKVWDSTEEILLLLNDKVVIFSSPLKDSVPIRLM